MAILGFGERKCHEKRDPLRKLSEEERAWLERISRSRSEPASHVTRPKQLLAVADGLFYTEAARSAAIKSGDTTSSLARRFNQVGLEALQPKQGGGVAIRYVFTDNWVICIFSASGTVNNPAVLPGTAWKLVSFGQAHQQNATVSDVNATLKFGKDGKIAGNFGCNSFSGDYIVSGSQVCFGAMI